MPMNGQTEKQNQRKIHIMNEIATKITDGE